MKIFPGLIASLLITVLIGAAMFLVGGNALLNPNTVPVSNSPQAVSAAANNAQANQPQVQQLESLVQQYQQREQQYQTQLNTAAQRLNQADQQLQSYQQLIDALQQQGVIRITSNGQVLIPRQGRGSDDGFFGGNN